MAILSKAGIVTGGVIEPPHVTQIIDALTASGSVIDISITGSLNVAGATRLGTLGTSTQSPLVFNPDVAGNSVFYVKNNGGLKFGTGANPYLGGVDFLSFDGSGNTNFGQNVNVAGNIAIGNTSPRLFFTDTDGNPDFSLINNNGNFIIYNDTNTRSDLFISSSGKIGIGTTNTRAQLDVVGGIYTDSFISTGGATVTGSAVIQGGNLAINNSYAAVSLNDPSNNDYAIINDLGNLVIQDTTAAANRLRMLSNGYIGINKNIPNSVLDVNGDTIVTGSLVVTSNITSSNNILVNSGGITVVGRSSFDGGIDLVDSSLDLWGNGGNININNGTLVVTGSTSLFNDEATLNLYGTNSSYIQWYPDNSARRAYFGFAASGSSNIILENEYTNGNIVLVTSGSGRIGINKYTPNASLDVNGNAIVSGSLTTTGNVVITGSLTLTSLVTASGDIRTSGNIKTNSGLIDLGGGSGLRTAFINSGVSTLEINRAGAAAIIFSNGITATERMSITTAGAVKVANLGTGTVYSNAGVLTSTSPSDFNLKKDITPIEYGLNEILQLNAVSFNWKEDKINQGKQFGFIAQEVREIMPDLVKTGSYLGLDKEAIFTIFTKAIQEQQTQIEELKLQVATLLSSSIN